MPDQAKRPNVAQRSHSSASVSFAKSPSDTLSGSAQRQKASRHIVGQGRLGPRVPSYGKNVNKLNKQFNAARVPDVPTSAQNSHIKRNSSHAQLGTASSGAALRKNHSETSLKHSRNRSSGQLTKLARPNSSRNVNKAGRKLNKRSKSQTMDQLEDNHDHPSVHFDLGQVSAKHEEEQDAHGEADGWTNYSDSRSPSTSRSNTHQNSRTTSPYKEGGPLRAEEDRPPDDSFRESSSAEGSKERVRVQSNGHASQNGSPSTQRAPIHAGRQPDADRITSRLLRRNVSFNAAPLLSSNAATPVIIDPHGPMSGGLSTLSDGSNPELISRFLNGGSSTSTTPFDHKLWPTHSPHDNQSDDDEPRRNKSVPNFAAMRVKRTQQRLDLERESAALESPNLDGPSLNSIRASRLSSVDMPYYAASSGVDGRSHPHVRKLFEQTNVEYNRMRMYQNPLADALVRLQEIEGVPRPHIPAKPKPGGKGGLLAASSGDGRYGLSQSWRSQKSSKSVENTASAARETTGHRRPRVMFQGIKDDDNRDRRNTGSFDDSAEQKELRAHGEEVREICRRI